MNSRTDHSAIRVRTVLLAMLAWVCLVGLSLSLLQWWFKPRREPGIDWSATAGGRVPAELFDLEQQAEREHLHSTGWLDRQRGIAFIPIETAMKLVLEQYPTNPQSAEQSQ